ncbi:MAG: hypothetical protein B7Y80_19610 [Hyphomicrobium sp. 32-62-53]|nr:MAG: hypothetical protein B7Z29_19810 [Hyphomicrobium sp. 12-62-95]OYX97471.1 MAG: hypothetical protein B7Y80_19610 [Hyphomicrobium sp. 32-62-53]
MAAPLPTRSRTIFVFLGASKYSRDPSFAEVERPLQDSHAQLKAYATNGFQLPPENILDLFNANLRVDEYLEGLRNGLHECYSRLGRALPIDVIVYYIGHGVLASTDRKLHLTVSISDHTFIGETCIDIRRLGMALANGVPNGRFYLFLDCCNAAAAIGNMSFDAFSGQDGTSGHFPLSHQVPRPEADRRSIPFSGGTFVTASANATSALAPVDEPCSRFTQLLLAVLGKAQNPFVLSAKELCEQMQIEAASRRSSDPKWALTQDPRWFDDRNQRQPGSVGEIPIFSGPWPKPTTDFVFKEPDSSDQFVCVTVCPEGTRSRLPVRIESVLRERKDVERASGKKIGKVGNAIHRIDLGTAFATDQSFLNCVRAVSRADLAVFDISETEAGVQPGIMLLLGIRAAAKRGVTICSVEGDPDTIYNVSLPYNLQFLNIAAHDSGNKEVRTILDLGNKIVSGFVGLRDDPDYADLPAFHALRTLGGEPEQFAVERYFTAPLIFSPLDQVYESECFEKFWPSVRGVLSERAAELENIDRSSPIIPRRLSERTEARMVMLSLYRSIRRCEFCMVDLTLLKPNVLFEAGVRLATHARGCVAVVADLEPHLRGALLDRIGHGAWPAALDPTASDDDRARLNALSHLGHVSDLFRILGPLTYLPASSNHYPYSTEELEAASSQVFETFYVRRQNGTIENDAIFRTVAAEAARRSRASIGGTEAELSQLARSSYVRDRDGGQVTVLFGEAQPSVRASAILRAMEFQAAEIMLGTVRTQVAKIEFTSEEAAKLRRRLTHIRALMGDLRWLSPELVEYAQALVLKVESFLSVEEVELARRDDHGLVFDPARGYSIEEVLSLTEALRDRNEELRRQKQFEEALKVIGLAIQAYRETSYIKEIEAAGSLSFEQSILLRDFADSLGRSGGLNRRLGNYDAMLKSYEEGAKYERLLDSFGTTATYNLVNFLNARIEAGKVTVQSLRGELTEAESKIDKRTKGAGAGKAWDWADLGQCRLLLGDIEGASQAYETYVALADPETVLSTIRVLESLAAKLKTRGEPEADYIGEGIKIIRTLALGGENPLQTANH